MSKRQAVQQKQQNNNQNIYHANTPPPRNPYENYGYGHRAAHVQQISGQYTQQPPQYTVEQQHYAAQMNAYNNAAYYYPQAIQAIPTPQYYTPPPPPPHPPTQHPHPQNLSLSEPEPPAKRGRTNTYIGVPEMSYAQPPQHTRKQQRHIQPQRPPRAAIPQRPNFPSNNEEQQMNPNKRSHNAISGNTINSRSSKRQAQGVAKAGRSTPVLNKDRTRISKSSTTNPDDKRRTLTDFRITTISIPTINWQWKQFADGDDAENEDGSKDNSKDAKDAAKEMARLRLYFASPASLEKKRGTVPLTHNPPSKDDQEETGGGTSTGAPNHDPFDSKIREIEEKMDKTGMLEPSSNRVSISYDRNTRRIVLDAELIEHVIIKRKEGTISIKMRLQRVDDPLSNMVESATYLPESEKQNILNTHKAQLDADRADRMRICPGVIVEVFDGEQESYIPLSKQMEEAEDNSIPPFQRLVVPAEQREKEGLPQLSDQFMAIECALETKQPLTEARWVRNGNVEEWIEQTVSGAAFNPYKNFIAKQQHLSARVGWHGKIQVVDPDPPPSLVSRMNSWAKSCTLYSLKERHKFLTTWFGLSENLVEKEAKEVKNKGADRLNQNSQNAEDGEGVGDGHTEDADNDKNSVNGEINDMVKELEVLAREQDDVDVDGQLVQSQSQSQQQSQTQSLFPTAEDYEISEAGTDAAIEILTRFIPLPVVSQSMKVILKSASRGDIFDQVRKLPQNLINRSIEYAFKDYYRMTGKSRH